MARAHVKKNDTVVVISGAGKGKRGKILSTDRAKSRVVVEGVNVRKKTVRRSQTNPQGGIIEVACPIHISNVMLGEKYDTRHKDAEVSTSETSEEPQQDRADVQDEVQKND